MGTVPAAEGDLNSPFGPGGVDPREGGRIPKEEGRLVVAITNLLPGAGGGRTGVGAMRGVFMSAERSNRELSIETDCEMPKKDSSFDFSSLWSVVTISGVPCRVLGGFDRLLAIPLILETILTACAGGRSTLPDEGDAAGGGGPIPNRPTASGGTKNLRLGCSASVSSQISSESNSSNKS